MKRPQSWSSYLFQIFVLWALLMICADRAATKGNSARADPVEPLERGEFWCDRFARFLSAVDVFICVRVLSPAMPSTLRTALHINIEQAVDETGREQGMVRDKCPVMVLRLPGCLSYQGGTRHRVTLCFLYQFIRRVGHHQK